VYALWDVVLANVLCIHIDGLDVVARVTIDPDDRVRSIVIVNAFWCAPCQAGCRGTNRPADDFDVRSSQRSALCLRRNQLLLECDFLACARTLAGTCALFLCHGVSFLCESDDPGMSDLPSRVQADTTPAQLGCT